MVSIGKFAVKVHKTSDKKKLKEGYETYSYGSISIRDPRLNDFIGKEVEVDISTKRKK